MGDSGPGSDGGQADAEGSPFQRARSAWRRWRHTRPFWGGLLVLLGAGEILLSERAPLPLVIHIGLQGLAGYLIPAILLLCGLLLWFHPVQKTFYSILAVLLSLGSWITSNLGGFFVGMLLGLIGGSLAFAWTSGGDHRPVRRHRKTPRADEPSEGLGLILGGPEPGSPAALPEADGLRARDGGETEQLWPNPGPRGVAAEPGRTASGGGAMAGNALLALPAAPLALVMLAGVGQHGPLPGGALASSVAVLAASSAANPVPTLNPTPTLSPIPTLSPTPVPSPTPTASPTPTGSPTPTTSPSTPAPSATPKPSPRPRRVHVRHASAAGLRAAAVPSSLTAGTATLTGLSFDGVAKVPTAKGAVPMLKFSMSSMTLTGAVLTFSKDGHPLVTRGSSLAFNGGVVLYATKISGDVDGVLVTFTPKQPPVTLSSDITLTNLVTDQPYAAADSLAATGLEIPGS